MKAILLAMAVAAPTLTPLRTAPKPALACVVQTPRGPKACAPEAKRPSPCVVVVLKSDGSKRLLPCQ